jgi:hypothetical protein
MNVPELTAASAILRIVNEDGRSVFSANKVSPPVSTATAAGFVDAVEKLYNDGQCEAKLRKLKRAGENIS